MDHQDAVEHAKQLVEDIGVADWGAASETLGRLSEFVTEQNGEETDSTDRTTISLRRVYAGFYRVMVTSWILAIPTLLLLLLSRTARAHSGTTTMLFVVVAVSVGMLWDRSVDTGTDQ